MSLWGTCIRLEMEHKMSRVGRWLAAAGFAISLSALLAAAWAGSGPGAAPGFRKAPYLLFDGKPSQMRLCWQLWEADTCVVCWGCDSTQADSELVSVELSTDHLHVIVLGGLLPAHPYFYSIKGQTCSFTGQFRSAAWGEQADAALIVYGDTRSQPQMHDSVAAAILDFVGSSKAWYGLVLFVGDAVVHGDSEDSWDDEFFSPSMANVRELMSSMPVQACMGNHEESGALFEHYFPYPFQCGGRYWSFDYGPVHVAVLDQYTNAWPDSAQIAWLAEDLASSERKWKIVVLHEPGWSAGGHPDNALVREWVHPLCVRFGVAAVFGGHNHYYARALVDGVEHITTGGGGAPLYTPDLGAPQIVSAARAYHFCALEICSGVLTFKAVGIDGTVLDSFVAGPPDGWEEELRGAVLIDKLYPNPASERASLVLRLRVGQAVEAALFDPGGRVASRLGHWALSAGSVGICLDLASGRSGRLPTGTYVLALHGEKGSDSRKLVLVR